MEFPPLDPNPVPAPREITFAITYEQFAGRVANAELRGQGRLEVRGTGTEATFTFSGDQRRAFSFRREIQFIFRTDEITNVTVTGKSIEFHHTTHEVSRPTKSFVFFGASAAEALDIVRLMPTSTDEEYSAALDFAARLNRLPGASSPWTSVTGLLIEANALAFVVMGLLGAGWVQVTDLAPYMKYGANNGGATTDGEWWRLFTSMFLHYGIIHLALNMWALFQAGQILEKLLGRSLFLLVYLGAGLTGSLTTLLWHGDKIWSAGASGAVFGIFGGLLGYMLREKHALPKSVYQPGLKSALSFAAYNLIFGLVIPRIDNAAHIGGLLGGLVLGWLVAVPVDLPTRLRLIPQRIRLGAAVLTFAIIAGVIVAPRYPYRLSEEFAWSAAIKAPAAQEPEVLKRQESALKTYALGKPNPELTRWLNDEGIPFTESWLKTMEGLTLTPGRTTAERRAGFVKILRLRLEGYRHLLAATEAGDPRALAKFRAEERNLKLAIGKINAPR